MKKRQLSQKLILIFLALIFTINLFPLTNAQPSIPDITSINQETGQLKTFEEFKDTAETLSKEEKRKEYLKQEWTNLLAENKFIAPILFYTDKGLSLLNPFWNIIFGIEFSWSFAFFLSLIIWIAIAILVHTPIKEFLNLNIILTSIFALTIASIMGYTKVISKAVDFISSLIINFWLLVFSIIIAILLIWMYVAILKIYGKKLKEESEKEKTHRARKTIQASGEVAEEILK